MIKYGTWRSRRGGPWTVIFSHWSNTLFLQWPLHPPWHQAKLFLFKWKGLDWCLGPDSQGHISMKFESNVLKRVSKISRWVSKISRRVSKISRLSVKVLWCELKRPISLWGRFITHCIAQTLNLRTFFWMRRAMLLRSWTLKSNWNNTMKNIEHSV